MDGDKMSAQGKDERENLPFTPYNSTSSIAMGDESDEDDNETPVFVDLNDAVEVKVDDDDAPMEDDDEEEDDEGDESPPVDIVDMSKAKLQTHTGHVYTVSAHYDRATLSLTVLSGGGDDKAFLHRIIPGSEPSTIPLAHAHTDSVCCSAFNMDYISDEFAKTPKLAAVGGYDGAIVIYDPDTGNILKELEGPSDVEWMCFHPKGGSVLLAGSVEDGTIWMYHVPTSKCMQVFVGHESGVTAGAFTPDGRWALSASSDGTLRVWAPRTGMSKHVFRLGEGGAGLTSMAVNGGPDGQLVMVGAEDGMAYVCHPVTNKVVASMRHFEPPLSPIADGKNDDDDNDDEVELPMSVEAVGFASVAVNPTWCATGGVDGVLKIWDLTMDGQCRQVCQYATTTGGPSVKRNNAGGITRLRWHPTMPLVFTSYSDGSVRLWDARNGTLVETLTGHADMINDLDIVFVDVENQGGTAVIVTGSDDMTVRIYEVVIASALQAVAHSTVSGGP